MIQMNQSQGTTNPSDSFLEHPDFKKPDFNMLNGFYTDADSADQAVFAEQRSNILLVAGEHYTRKGTNLFRRIRDTKDLSNEQKLRLTKNHIQKICKIYANNILAMNPGVGFEPKDETSIHDQKVSEIHHSVWRDAIERYSLADKMDDWCDSFVQIGEVAVKLFYDPTLGTIKDYENVIDPATGQPAMDLAGQFVKDKTKPIMTGEFVFEEVYGFNLLRPPECKDMKKAEWLCIRKMVDTKELMKKITNEELRAKIGSDQDETYMIFDALAGGYKKSSKQTMVREFYFRPSIIYPQGYFYITTKDGVIAEGELPGGYFPIIFAAFDKIQTTPRGRSPIKTMRPYQVEINRCASKIAEHHITLGDDKLLLQNGTKASAGMSIPGIRTINYTGAKPEVIQGRDGSQYVNTMTANIIELYQVMMVYEDMEEKGDGKLDPYILLYRSAKSKKKFQRYIARFERFLIEIVQLYLKLAKIHLPDDALITKIGKNEQVNIPEFRMMKDTCYEVNIEAQSDDIETKIGKQVFLNHALQYIGQNLKPEDVGKIMKQMPFANVDESFDDFTIDYDTSVNDILALDRGEQPPINQYDNHEYCIKRLTLRTRKPDFKFLAPNIQRNYYAKIALHEKFQARKILEMKRMEQGLIPTGGALITVDFYTNSPTQSGGIKAEKAKLPYESVAWLIKQLEAQGSTQEALAQMSGGAQEEIARMVNGQAGLPGAHIPFRPPQMAG